MFVCHLQINGQDVQDREEAMAALSNDECRNIVLLVARPEIPVRNTHLPHIDMYLSPRLKNLPRAYFG